MRDKLPSNPCNVERIIINLDSNFGPGTHWVAIKKNKNHAFYFDSYGDLPPPPEIVKYLGRRVFIKFNANNYQTFNTEICGQLCLAFLL